MASAHRSLVLPLSRPVVDQGIEDHRKRRAIAPAIARRLVNGSGRTSPKISSLRFSPDAYDKSQLMGNPTHLDGAMRPTCSLRLMMWPGAVVAPMVRATDS